MTIEEIVNFCYEHGCTLINLLNASSSINDLDTVRTIARMLS